ncbi:hypothetical protein CAEBREN_05360 [Caenorhabditis brenneri]|uniref:Uncharacterized protein n=1 Tax=Caenorhabditis brenneri TaxID=135651 RepID=G0MIA5_CAEBE|nr:hypothetical protein CAEBREN_05360 [Caenorhabditis brenneri]
MATEGGNLFEAMSGLIEVQEKMINELKKENQLHMVVQETSSIKTALVVCFSGLVLDKMNRSIMEKDEALKKKDEELASLRKIVIK